MYENGTCNIPSDKAKFTSVLLFHLTALSHPFRRIGRLHGKRESFAHKKRLCQIVLSTYILSMQINSNGSNRTCNEPYYWTPFKRIQMMSLFPFTRFDCQKTCHFPPDLLRYFPHILCSLHFVGISTIQKMRLNFQMEKLYQ